MVKDGANENQPFRGNWRSKAFIQAGRNNKGIYIFDCNHKEIICKLCRPDEGEKMNDANKNLPEYTLKPIMYMDASDQFFLVFMDKFGVSLHECLSERQPSARRVVSSILRDLST